MDLCGYQEIGLQDINNYTRWLNGPGLFRARDSKIQYTTGL